MRSPGQQRMKAGPGPHTSVRKEGPGGIQAPQGSAGRDEPQKCSTRGCLTSMTATPCPRWSGTLAPSSQGRHTEEVLTPVG